MSSPRYRVMVSEIPGSDAKPWRDQTYQSYTAAELAREQALIENAARTVWIEVEQTQWVIAHA